MGSTIREIRGIAASLTCDECGEKASIAPGSRLADGTEVMDWDDLIAKVEEMGWATSYLGWPHGGTICPACQKRRHFQSRNKEVA